MQATVEVLPPLSTTFNQFRSPLSTVSISADSSRRGSSWHSAPDQDLQTSIPSPPQTRMTRKRAASLDLEGALYPRLGALALNSASTPLADTTREQVCLCQPDPKIPRPRNAFILYRQHYQAQVVAQHPGLANPEISKVIGEQWRDEPPEVKNEWKRLAEEEKQRHQRQYPGYRYQPRRPGRSNSTHPISVSSAESPQRCPKCSGRYILTPSSPLTPFTPAFGSANGQNDHSLPSFASSAVAELVEGRHSAKLSITRMNTPRMSPPEQVGRRMPYPQAHSLQTHREMDEDVEVISPNHEPKRRRFNNESQKHLVEPPRGYAGSPISYSTPQPFARNIAQNPSVHRQQQLPGPQTLSRTETLPQASPISANPRHSYPTRSSTFDESLRLPPLQTQSLNSISTTTQRGSRSEAYESQAKSIEAMIMTIPFLNKIRVLRKISPPLQPPGPSSPTYETRGAVIVIEGPDNELRGDVGSFIFNHISEDVSCAVKTWTTSPPRTSFVSGPKSATTDTEMDDVAAKVLTPQSPIPKEKDPFIEYLNVISDWHTKSREMIKHITTATPAPAKTIPIAIVPDGFSLTTSDKYALLIPINDSYAPVDHWQWMSTLWRGIVGPDLTIYVVRMSKEDVVKLGSVEIRAECNTITVRVAPGETVDEKMRRRLGFEVLEFVRSVESGFERA